MNTTDKPKCTAADGKTEVHNMPGVGLVVSAAAFNALVRYAERYRWLRDEAWGGNNRSGPHLVVYRPGLMPSAVTELAEDAADTAIDDAMQEKQS